MCVMQLIHLQELHDTILLAQFFVKDLIGLNIFGAHCNIVSDKESFTDSNYIIRTIVLEQETTNNITGIRNGKRQVINKQPWNKLELMNQSLNTMSANFYLENHTD